MQLPLTQDLPVTRGRSALMARIRTKNTKPEISVRKLAHGLGYRFRLHASELAGTPDIVFPRLKKVVFVHGCFWHRHSRCSRATIPKTRVAFWIAKFAANIERDAKNRRALRRAGWKVLIVWECEIKSSEMLRQKLGRFLSER